MVLSKSYAAVGCSAGIFPKAASVIWYQLFLGESVTFVRTLKVRVEIQTRSFFYHYRRANFFYTFCRSRDAAECMVTYENFGLSNFEEVNAYGCASRTKNRRLH
jgi:hypothetical protein